MRDNNKTDPLNFNILKPQLNPTTKLFAPEILCTLLQVLTWLNHDQTCQNVINTQQTLKNVFTEISMKRFFHKEKYKAWLFTVFTSIHIAFYKSTGYTDEHSLNCGPCSFFLNLVTLSTCKLMSP